MGNGVIIVRPFMQIPFDLSDAVADLGLGRYQQIILNTILKEVLGPAKASLVTINQADLSRRHGVHRQHLNRGLQDLLKLRIIVQHGSGYGFNYVTSEWTRNGESLPSFASMTVTTDDAASVDVTKSGYKQAEVVTKSGYTHVTENGYKSTDSSSPCNQERLHMSPNLVTNVTESGYTSSIEMNLEKTTRGDVVGESGSDQKQECIQPQGQSVLTSQESSAPPSVKSTQEWTDIVNDWLGKNRFDSNLFYRQLTAWINEYGGEWTLKAIQTVMMGDKPNNPVKYVRGTLENYRKAGGPEQAEAKHEAAKQEAKKPAPEPLDMSDPKNWTPEYREKRNKWLEELKALDDAERPRRLERAKREKEEREKKWGMVG